MTESTRPGEVFDAVAEKYDVHRSGYPDEIVDAAVGLAGLDAGSAVLEVGCGTGKLTEHLVARGLHVVAVDPGPNMIKVARRRVGSSRLVDFRLGRFEDVPLPDAGFDAVFSASAFHWVDPQLGWARVAAVLRPRGTFALIQPITVRDEVSGDVLDQLREALDRLAPEITAEFPALRDEPTIRAGAMERRENASEVWAWLAHPGLAVPEAATLFGPATLTTVPRRIEQTADELWARFETTSLYDRLTEATRAQLRADDARIIDDHGGTLRTTQLVALLTTQRIDRAGGATRL